MNKKINFTITDKTQLTERIIEYFTKSGFTFVKTNDDTLKFIHSSSLFDTWTTNPLKWGSEIIVSINDNSVTADFCVDTDSQMNSSEEENVWNNFIVNFKSFMTDKTELRSLNNNIIKNVQKSRLLYIGWTVVGAFLGGFVGLYFSNLTGSKTIGYFTIPVMAALFLKQSINYKKHKNAL